MFNGSVASSLENVTIETERGLKTVQQVTISDISPKVFKDMLRYLYLDEIKLDNKSVVDIIYCGMSGLPYILTQRYTYTPPDELRESPSAHKSK